MSVRLWTHGWDFFAPGVNVVYHLWERTHRPSFRENTDEDNLQEKSRSRVKYILGILDENEVDPDCLVEIEKYGLPLANPSSRTLRNYQDLAGIFFKQGTVTDKARYGGLQQSDFMEDLLAMVLRVANLNAT
eukprot:TRINITY_DN5804_c0_g1_i3.p1 TRINITY_DN5804_c0_g1~~TRINITY_DN5804_c0_g1_i3.p1  ORF type:complete len:132 (+),score=24.36 TRINITY_DN5804_c0_g1_i3:766-1161(+)